MDDNKYRVMVKIYFDYDTYDCEYSGVYHDNYESAQNELIGAISYTALIQLL